MMKKRLRKWGIGFSALLMAVLIGCQPVGGLNLDDMILNQLDVAAVEQSSTLDVAFDWNPKALKQLDPKAAAMAAWLNTVSLKITHSQTDAQGRAHVTGSLALGSKGAIPFTFHTDGKKFRFDVEGAKRPLVLDLSKQLTAGGPLQPAPAGMTEQVRKMIRTAAPYFVKHIPNAPTVNVESVTSTVYGESLKLTKVHAELNGEQLGELIPQYLDALVKDEAGFKETLRTVVTWVSELPQDVVDQLGGADLFPAGDDKEVAIQEGFDQLFPMLKEAQTSLAKAKEDMTWGLVFDKGITLKTDLYVDDKLHLRKTDTEIVIAPTVMALAVSPIHSVKIHSTSEMWNVNGDVKVPDVVIPDNALHPDDLVNLQPQDALKLFDDRSVIYDILKNDLQIDDTTFELTTDDLYPIYVSGEGSQAIVDVPVRASVREFGDTITYTARTGEVRITDVGTSQEIVLHNRSTEATVNGVKVKLKQPVHQIDSSFYMGAEDLFGLLHATYTLTNKPDEGLSVLSVKRDL